MHHTCEEDADLAQEHDLFVLDLLVWAHVAMAAVRGRRVTSTSRDALCVTQASH